jgi:hypothetical protein
MKIKRNGRQASIKGPSDWFTGTVRIDLGKFVPEMLSGSSLVKSTGTVLLQR